MGITEGYFELPENTLIPQYYSIPKNSVAFPWTYNTPAKHMPHLLESKSTLIVRQNVIFRLHKHTKARILFGCYEPLLVE